MTYTMTSQNIDLSSWDTLYTHTRVIWKRCSSGMVRSVDCRLVVDVSGQNIGTILIGTNIGTNIVTIRNRYHFQASSIIWLLDLWRRDWKVLSKRR